MVSTYTVRVVMQSHPKFVGGTADYKAKGDDWPIVASSPADAMRTALSYMKDAERDRVGSLNVIRVEPVTGV